MDSNANIAKQNRHKFPLNNFTEREIAVLWSVMHGWENKQIAKYLCITPRTVKFHLAQLFEKTNTKNRTELTQRIFLYMFDAPIDFAAFSRLFSPK